MLRAGRASNAFRVPNSLFLAPESSDGEADVLRETRARPATDLRQTCDRPATDMNVVFLSIIMNIYNYSCSNMPKGPLEDVKVVVS